jgi:hypothetical protein
MPTPKPVLERTHPGDLSDVTDCAEKFLSDRADRLPPASVGSRAKRARSENQRRPLRRAGRERDRMDPAGPPSADPSGGERSCYSTPIWGLRNNWGPLIRVTTTSRRPAAAAAGASFLTLEEYG